jgi:hypothetical protein
MNIQERLRDYIANIRRKPTPIVDLIPLLRDAADRIEFLEAKVRYLQDPNKGPSLKELTEMFKDYPDLEISGKLPK